MEANRGNWSLEIRRKSETRWLREILHKEEFGAFHEFLLKEYMLKWETPRRPELFFRLQRRIQRTGSLVAFFIPISNSVEHIEYGLMIVSLLDIYADRISFSEHACKGGSLRQEA